MQKKKKENPERARYAALLLITCLIGNMSVSQDCVEKRGEFVGSACGPKGPYVPDVLFWCVLLFFSTVIMSAFLKNFKFSNYFPTKVKHSPSRAG